MAAKLVLNNECSLFIDPQAFAEQPTGIVGEMHGLAGQKTPHLPLLTEIADARARLETLKEPSSELLAEANALFRSLVNEGG